MAIIGPAGAALADMLMAQRAEQFGVEMQAFLDSLPAESDPDPLAPLPEPAVRAKPLNFDPSEEIVIIGARSKPNKSSKPPTIVTDSRGRRINKTPNVDYASFNSAFGTEIDFSFISRWEGGVYLDSYVPWSVNSSPKNHSGVTVVGGLDLGGKDRSYFSSAGVSDDLIDQIAPAFGKKQSAALDWNRRYGIHLTAEQGDILERATGWNQLKAAKADWNSNRASGQPLFQDLSPGQQTAFYSRYFNGGKAKPWSDFYQHAYKGDWTGASTVLLQKATLPSYSTWSNRLKAEAALLVPRH